MNRVNVKFQTNPAAESEKQRLLVNQLLAKAGRFYDASCDTNGKNLRNAHQNREKSKTSVQRILDLEPDHADALNLLGRICLDEGELNMAATCVDKALTLQPNKAGYHYSRGHIYLACQEYQLAEKSFQCAIKTAPAGTRSQSSLAYTKTKQGKYVVAFQQYREMIREDRNNPQVRSKLFECIRELQADVYSEDLALDVISYLQFEEVNHNDLATLVATLLIHKYQLMDGTLPLELQAISRDKLLVLALEKLYFTDPIIEDFLIALRKILLIETLSQANIDENCVLLAVSLGIHASNNEYVYPIDDQEQGMLDALEELLETATAETDWHPTDISGAAVMYSMYNPLHKLKIAKILSTFDATTWSQQAHAVIQHSLYEPIAEMHQAKHISSIGKITNPVSKQVQQQYEEHPYPRWNSLNFHTPTPYGQALQAELRGFKPAKFFNKAELQILIAGCGTGRHALHVAKYFSNVSVLGVDLSRRSLAYAEKMAKRYNIDNVSFVHADILNGEMLKKRFHIIECSGVLHHMQDPMMGWKKLTRLLLPDGVMKVGLYSEVARQSVEKSRKIIGQNGLQPTPEHIRGFRSAILSGQLGEDFSGIIRSPDFYTMSGCRDLLFHVQEHRFTPLDIKSYISTLGLDFLGFVQLSPATKRAYSIRYPDDKNLLNLENWHEFERDAPATFSRLYQFYLQRTNDSPLHSV